MNHVKTVFAEVIGFLPKRQFRRSVERYKGNYQKEPENRDESLHNITDFEFDSF